MIYVEMDWNDVASTVPCIMNLPLSNIYIHACTHTLKHIHMHAHTQDPKRHLEEKVDTVLTANITQSLGAMLDTVVFS